MRRIETYEEILKEGLIIYLLKSKLSSAELFNSNRDNNQISDIKEILYRSRDILPRKYTQDIKKKLHKIVNKKNRSKLEEETNKYLIKLVRILRTEEKYR